MAGSRQHQFFSCIQSRRTAFVELGAQKELTFRMYICANTYVKYLYLKFYIALNYNNHRIL